MDLSRAYCQFDRSTKQTKLRKQKLQTCTSRSTQPQSSGHIKAKAHHTVPVNTNVNAVQAATATEPLINRERRTKFRHMCAPSTCSFRFLPCRRYTDKRPIGVRGFCDWGFRGTPPQASSTAHIVLISQRTDFKCTENAKFLLKNHEFRYFHGP